MAKLSIQFHALREELAALAEFIQSHPSYQLHVVSEKPFRVTLWDGNTQSLCEVDSCIFSILVTLSSADTVCNNVDDFLAKNPNTLILELGRITERGLSESWLAAMTKDDLTAKTWKKITNEVKRITTAGVIATNPNTGARVILKANRVTKGARLAYLRGIKLCPAAGNAVLEPI